MSTGISSEIIAHCEVAQVQYLFSFIPLPKVWNETKRKETDFFLRLFTDFVSGVKAVRIEREMKEWLWMAKMENLDFLI